MNDYIKVLRNERIYQWFRILSVTKKFIFLITQVYKEIKSYAYRIQFIVADSTWRPEPKFTGFVLKFVKIFFQMNFVYWLFWWKNSQNPDKVHIDFDPLLYADIFYILRYTFSCKIICWIRFHGFWATKLKTHKIRLKKDLRPTDDRKTKGKLLCPKLLCTQIFSELPTSVTIQASSYLCPQVGREQVFSSQSQVS